jgi:LAS superfamily LD-carboxypeptidase LdcB
MKWPWLLLAAVVLTVGETARRLVATGYFKGEAFPVELLDIGGGFMLESKGAAPAFIEMRQKAAEQGVFLVVDSGFRTEDEQEELLRRYAAGDKSVGKPAPAGYSNHQQGLAVDIDTTNGTNAAFIWLTANAYRFGFRRTVPSEPWHWEYRQAWAEEALLS